MWYDIIAASMGFMGSITFSAGLIKSRRQILDENASYWEANPFTLKAELESQPYYMIGIGVLIAGFATSIAGKIASLFVENQVLISVLIALLIALVGFLGCQYFIFYRAGDTTKILSITVKKSSLIHYVTTLG